MSDQQTPAPDAPETPDPAKAGAPPWYCDQCGARYFAPGTCTNQHPPADLLRDPSVPLPDETPAAPQGAAADVTGTTADAGTAAAPAEAAAAAPPVEAAAPPPQVEQLTPVEAAPAPQPASSPAADAGAAVAPPPLGDVVAELDAILTVLESVHARIAAVRDLISGTGAGQ